MNERYVTLMRFRDLAQAEFHRELLENEGIDVVIVDDRPDDQATPELLPDAGGPVLLQVPETEAERAGQILEEGFDERMGDDNPSVV
jgi:hypothetical protein